MKLLFGLLISMSVFAAEPIVIDTNKISLPDSLLKEAVVLERNSNTPTIVELTVPSHPQKECVKYETKQVFGESASCGSYSVPECRNEEFDCESRVRCTMPSELFGCQREEWYKVCQNRVVCSESTRYVSCYHDTKVCVEYKDIEVAPKKALLIFKLKKRHAKRTQLIRLTLNAYNGLSLYSPQLDVDYHFGQSAWVLTK